MWHIAYIFLLLDQLPSGGWSKTLNMWMELIWEGDNNSIPRNQNMRISGGTDLSAYAFYQYRSILKSAFDDPKIFRLCQLNGVADRVYENFRGKIGYKGGIGTRQIPHGGSLSEVRIRHTLMGIITFLLYGELKQFSVNIQDVLENTSQDLKEHMEHWEYDQTHLFAMVAAAVKLHSILQTDIAKKQLSSARIKELISLLEKHIPNMELQRN